MEGSVTCPGAIRAENRKAEHREWWMDPRWIEKSQAWLPGRVCKYCGKPAEVVHHDESWMYDSFAIYMDEKNWTALCHECHGKYGKGRVKCPSCDDGYMMKGDECCYACKPEAVKEAYKANKIRRQHSQTKYQKVKRMELKRLCALCKAPIPAKNQDKLVEMGYAGMQINNGKMMYFCPEHTTDEIAVHIGKLLYGTKFGQAVAKA